MADSSSASARLLVVAASAAAAGSLLTLAAVRLRQARRQQQRGSHSAAAGAPHLQSNGELALPAAKQDPHDPSPRKDYLSWDDYFMAVAFLSAQRSKDPNKQVGACIVDAANVICGIGYNGFPRGCSDRALPWAKRSARGDPLDTKYPYVCHAEMNALLNKNGASVAGARVYVTMFPCNECAKLMIQADISVTSHLTFIPIFRSQAGISEVVYHEGKDAPPTRTDSTTTAGSFNRDQQYAASRRLLALAGVKLRQHLFRQPVLLRLTNDPAQPAVVAALAASSGDGSSASASGSAAAAGAQQEVPAPAPVSPPVSPAVAAVLQNGVSSGGSRGSSGGAASAEPAATSSAGAAAASGRRRRGRRQPSQQERHLDRTAAAMQ